MSAVVPHPEPSGASTGVASPTTSTSGGGHNTDMANQRSVLPKFRPATLGGSQRPQIRPVKPTAPPPAPTPPRRPSSASAMPPTTSYAPPRPAPTPPPTQAGMMAAARARIHEIARELPAENRFGGPAPRYDDETQGRMEA